MVSVLGTDISTITDVDGRFTLKEIPEKAQRIRVKYIGMQPKDVKIRPIMNVTLDLEKNWHSLYKPGLESADTILKTITKTSMEATIIYTSRAESD